MLTIDVLNNNRRLYSGPLDSTQVFDNFNDFKNYVENNKSAYAGQIIYIKNEDTVYILYEDENKMKYRKFGSVTENDFTLGEDIKVNIGEGMHIGGINDGAILNANTKLTDIFKRLFKREERDYLEPEINIVLAKYPEDKFIKLADNIYGCEFDKEISIDDELELGISFKKNNSIITSIELYQFGDRPYILENLTSGNQIIPYERNVTFNMRPELNRSIYFNIKYKFNESDEELNVKSNVIRFEVFKNVFYGSGIENIKSYSDVDKLNKKLITNLNDEFKFDISRGDKYIQIAIPNKVNNKKMKIKSIISKSQGTNIINSFETHDISLKNTVYTSDERMYTLYHYEPIAGLFTNDDTIIVEYDEVR